MVLETGRKTHTSTSIPCGSRRLLWLQIYRWFSDWTGNKITAKFMLRLIRVIFISCLFVYGLYFIFSGPTVIEDETHGEITMSENNKVEIESQCKNHDGDEVCYFVVDLIDKKDPLNVHRALYVNGFETEYDTVVYLIPPKGKTALNSDTRFWTVNHSVITAQYVATMITQIFTVSAINLDEKNDDESSVLSIGLGGGNFDMFLHQKRPKIDITVVELEPIVVNLAQKWFGVQDDEKRRTLIVDGLEFIKNEESKGKKYNAIVLDACDNTKSIPCPVKDFLLSTNLQTIKNILKPMGVFIVNVLILDNSSPYMIEKSLTKKFPICLKMQMTEESNVIYSCLPYSLEKNSIDETKIIFETQMKKAIEILQINMEKLFTNFLFIKK